MKRVRNVLPLLLVLVLLSACASGIAWRKSAVTSYELAGIGLGHSVETANYLLSINAITAEQHLKFMALYGKAKSAYITAGNALITASATDDTIKRDALLEEYDKLLNSYKDLAYEVYALVKQFQMIKK